MRKSSKFFIAGSIMFIIGISFIAFALCHPEFSWNLPIWFPIEIIQVFYLLYLFANIACFVVFGVLRHKGK